MIRRPRTGSSTSTAGTLTGRVVRRVGGAVAGAGIGALAAFLAVSGSTDPSSLLHDAVTPDRTGDRPSRALDRDDEPTGGLADRLLPAAALTSPSPGRAWHVLHTELHEPRALAGSCHRFPLVSVGAIRVAHRAYALGRPRAPRATAEHVVARFADARTAWRAHEVLLAWQADCDETLADRRGVRLTELHDLDGAQRYAVTWSPGGAERVREDVALVRVGRRLALVRTSSSGPDLGPAVVAHGVTSARALLDPRR
jgi:hypothetical protein